MLINIFFSTIALVSAQSLDLQRQNLRLLKTNKILRQTLKELSREVEATVSNPLPEEKSVGEDICPGKSCSECLDGTDYACSFYDGKCILSESMKDPAAYKASKFVWMSEDCTDEDLYKKEDICAGKGCGECLDDTDYACAFYDGKCIPSESMMDPAAYKMSKFVWSSGDCPVAVACEDISIMDGDSTCGGLAAILGDLCNFDYGAPGAPCACMCGTMAEKDVAAMPREHTHGGSGRYGRPRAARETAVGPRRYYQDGDRLKETAVGPRRYYLKETAVGPRRHHRDGQEKAVGAEPCDEYCESWEKFKESKADDNSQEEICGMYKSTRCSTCADVQAYCGWKKVTEDEVYTYSVTPGGKCMTLDGADPKYLYEGGKGSECEQLCDGMIDCFGYSISGYDNCLLWLQRDIMGGGDEWGDADCHIKDVSCSGNVGDDYNCGECYNGFSRKYLWGSACQAKNWGADTYTKGVCGEEYKCFTNNEDIGECPYGEYCPSV